MTITCPNCKTTYNLADDRARPGARLRCTVCREVFPMPESQSRGKKAASGETLSIQIGQSGSARQKGGKKTLFFLLALLVLGGAFGAAWHFTPWLDPVKAMLASDKSPEADDAAQAARLAGLLEQIQMRDVRQYTIDNEKIGKVAVFEGKVVNGTDSPLELIRMEASLFDNAGKEVLAKSQLAGTMVSLFQLQVLDEDELERALNNKLDILSNNTNVPPGGMVPFMIVLYNPPAEATDFSLRAIDARLPQTSP